MQTSKAKKINTVIKKAGAKADPLTDTKAKILANIKSASADEKPEQVDDQNTMRDLYTIVKDSDGRQLSVYLMWSDLKDNHNKYYILQALVDKAGNYKLWVRYGRVGNSGVTNLASFGSSKE